MDDTGNFFERLGLRGPDQISKICWTLRSLSATGETADDETVSRVGIVAQELIGDFGLPLSVALPMIPGY